MVRGHQLGVHVTMAGLKISLQELATVVRAHQLGVCISTIDFSLLTLHSRTGHFHQPAQWLVLRSVYAGEGTITVSCIAQVAHNIFICRSGLIVDFLNPCMQGHVRVEKPR